ncbi:MAG: lectin-like domain-containing protein, partial [Leuconostoc falkenbergense]
MTNNQNKINRLYYLLAFSSTLLTVNQLMPYTVANASALISQSHLTQQQLISNFTTNGSAKVNHNIFTLTDDHPMLSGAAYQNT